MPGYGLRAGLETSPTGPKYLSVHLSIQDISSNLLGICNVFQHKRRYYLFSNCWRSRDMCRFCVRFDRFTQVHVQAPVRAMATSGQRPNEASLSFRRYSTPPYWIIPIKICPSNYKKLLKLKLNMLLVSKIWCVSVLLSTYDKKKTATYTSDI